MFSGAWTATAAPVKVAVGADVFVVVVEEDVLVGLTEDEDLLLLLLDHTAHELVVWLVGRIVVLFDDHTDQIGV